MTMTTLSAWRLQAIPMITLVQREVERFWNVAMQTILAPVVTTALFYMVFVIALGQDSRMIAGVSYSHFLIPGLIMMAIAQNAFANTSSSIIIAKVQGTFADLLIAPLSPLQLVMGFTIGAVIRGMVVGLAAVLIMAPFTGSLPYFPLTALLFAFLGSWMLAVLGIIGGLWAQKFDHMAAVTNFLVTPLTFLSGTFYDVASLPHPWTDFAHLNPFFFMIDGFRAGFTGIAESNLAIGALTLLVINIALSVFCWWLVKIGYKIKE